MPPHVYRHLQSHCCFARRRSAGQHDEITVIAVQAAVKAAKSVADKLALGGLLLDEVDQCVLHRYDLNARPLPCCGAGLCDQLAALIAGLNLSQPVRQIVQAGHSGLLLHRSNIGFPTSAGQGDFHAGEEQRLVFFADSRAKRDCIKRLARVENLPGCQIYVAQFLASEVLLARCCEQLTSNLWLEQQ